MSRLVMLNSYWTHQLDAFQEEPYLLDPYLSSIFAAITTHLRAALDSPAPKPQQQVDAYTQLAYTVLKVRGHKTIGKCFALRLSLLIKALLSASHLQ